MNDAYLWIYAYNSNIIAYFTTIAKGFFKIFYNDTRQAFLLEKVYCLVAFVRKLQVPL
jgi:hypothetical protein